MKQHMFNGQEIKVGDIWESPNADNSVVVIGFNSKDQPVVEINQDSNFGTKGDIDILSNKCWVKRVPKVTVYIYYRQDTKKFLTLTVLADTLYPQDLLDKIVLVEIRKYTQDQLKESS